MLSDVPAALAVPPPAGFTLRGHPLLGADAESPKAAVGAFACHRPRFHRCRRCGCRLGLAVIVRRRCARAPARFSFCRRASRAVLAPPGGMKHKKGMTCSKLKNQWTNTILNFLHAFLKSSAFRAQFACYRVIFF